MTEIRTEHKPKRSQECCHYANPSIYIGKGHDD
jgi:hypothetical protein